MHILDGISVILISLIYHAHKLVLDEIKCRYTVLLIDRCNSIMQRVLQCITELILCEYALKIKRE